MDLGTYLDAIYRLLASGFEIRYEQTGSEAFTVHVYRERDGVQARHSGNLVTYSTIALADALAPGAK